MEISFDFTLMIALALVAGIGAQVIATFLQVPGIVFLLPLGILLGPDGLGLIRPQELGVGLEVFVSVAVAVILFEGGLNLKVEELSQVSRSLRNLVTIGVGVTLLGAAGVAHYLGEFPWRIAFLYGSLVVVTGPTVITPILRRVRLQNTVNALLEGEGVLIDPIGAILSVVVLQVVLSGQTDLVSAVGQLALRLWVGISIGAVAGWLMGAFLRWSRQYMTVELRNSVVLALALAVFVLAQSLVSESGLMAVVIAGLVVRQTAGIEERSVRQFHSQLVVLAISVLFILLTASLSLEAVFALGWGSLAVVGVLMLVVRPLNVWLCTWSSDLGWREKLFIAWMGPRGIVAASVASLFSLLLTERGITGGDALKAVVFLTIGMTVMIQGLTAARLARWLGLEQGECTVIIGDHPLSRRLAQLLRSQGRSVELVSLLSSPGAEGQGHITHLELQPNQLDPEAEQAITEAMTSELHPDEVLNESVITKADIEHADTVIVLTLNPQVNWAISALTVRLFESARVWTTLCASMSASEGVRHLQTTTEQIEQWSQLLEEGVAQLSSITLPVMADLGWDSSKLPEGYGSSVYAGRQDLTRERIRDFFSSRVRVNACLPLMLLRPEPMDWLNQVDRTKVLILPEPEIWRRGDQVFYLEKAPTGESSHRSKQRGSEQGTLDQNLAVLTGQDPRLSLG